MAVILSVVSALFYGVSDFIGGLVSGRVSAWLTAATANVGLFVAIVAAFGFFPHAFSWPALWWGLASGVGAGLGGLFLYRGLARGRMGVVAPTSGLIAAALPVLVGVLLGEQPSALSWVGIALALPAIYLVARVPEKHADGKPSGLGDGVLAGLGFGVGFATTAQIPEEAGIWPLAADAVVGVLVVLAVAVLTGQRLTRPTWACSPALVAGALAGGAQASFLLATHHGMLAIVGVVSSLYPAATVILAVTVLRERIHPAQTVGLVGAGAAVALVALG